METTDAPPRNGASTRKPGWGKPKNPHRAPEVETAAVVTKRARQQQVDGVVGTGHPEMPLGDIARGLARLARKPPRTATVREIGGVPVALCLGIPVGTFALRTADRITAYRLGVPIVTVPCETAGVSDAAANNP